MTRVYAETHLGYSPILDAQAVRLSICDDRGGEYWSVLRHDAPKYRERREKALTAIVEAIESGRAPGEVSIS